MREFAFASPSLDLGCGDGIFSFIRAGGTVSTQFDVFLSVRNLNDFYENVDVYDAFQKDKTTYVVDPPHYRIDVAFDNKENSLKKSDQLKLYHSYVAGDANRRLPFSEESFNSIFSNIVYWLDEPKTILKEIYRVLRPGGHVCLMLPNHTFPNFSFYNQLYAKTHNKKFVFLEQLDRGRFKDNIRQAHSDHEWRKIFRQTGFEITMHRKHLSKTVIQIWDIGLRPLFPVLKKMVDQIQPDRYQDIKSEWVDTVRRFLEPIVEMDSELGQGVEAAFHCYVLEK
jgi:ubiquinone/menaquinone biosynthesis C-methylase UbiE